VTNLCDCGQHDVGPAPVCACCGNEKFLDCGMATDCGFGWFCTHCGFNHCTNCGTGEGVTVFDGDGSFWNSLTGLPVDR